MKVLDVTSRRELRFLFQSWMKHNRHFYPIHFRLNIQENVPNINESTSLWCNTKFSNLKNFVLYFKQTKFNVEFGFWKLNSNFEEVNK